MYQSGDRDIFWKHQGHGEVDRGEVTATVKRIKFHQRLDFQKWKISMKK